MRAGAGNGNSERLHRSHGFAQGRFISNEAGLHALDLCVRQEGQAVIGVIPIRWSTFLRRMGSAVPTLLAEFAGLKEETIVQHTESHRAKQTGTAFVQSLWAMNDRQERLSAVQKMVTTSVQDLSGAVIEIEAPLQEAGVDSLGATELHRQLQDKVGDDLILPSTLLFDYPTVSAMSEHIVDELDGVQSVSVTQVQAQADASQPGITGVACYAPGGCRSSAELRDLLGSGRDTTQCVPWSRFDMASAPPVEEVYVTHGHYLENVELFDHTSFKMGSAEARTTDPHQRLLLEVGCDALVKSGRDRGMMTRSDVGVYIGFTSVNEWNAVLAAKPDTIRVGAFYLGADSAAAAGRLSYVLGLKGPSLVVNTACSSSLVATDAAVQHLRSQRCPSALIAGVNLQLHVGGLVALCAAHAVAADGQCKTFDASADGYGRGEACGGL